MPTVAEQVQLRKWWLLREEIHADGDSAARSPVTRAAALIVLGNPYAGALVDDMSVLVDAGPWLTEQYLPRAMALLTGAPRAYGKAAIVGTAGEVEHGAALLHPRLGAAMRSVIGGGEAIIPSTCKVAGAGANIDVPLGHRHNVWSFDELDTLSVCIHDAPRPSEILLILALSDGGRPLPRIPSSRITSTDRNAS